MRYKDGRLLIGVPNIDSAPAKSLGKYWHCLGAPMHTYNFSVKQLQELLLRNGVEVDTVRYTGNCHGIVGSLQIYQNESAPNRTSIHGWLIN